MNHLVHLAAFEHTLVEGAEWQLSTGLWLVLQLSKGIAYTRCSSQAAEFPFGGVVVAPPATQFSILSSTIERAQIRGIGVRLDALSGFLTATERQCLESHAAKQCAPFVVLPGSHPFAKTISEVWPNQTAMTLPSRLAFLHGFAELLAPHFDEAALQTEPSGQDASARLKQFMNELPESELENFTLRKLSQSLHCGERHTNRLFRKAFDRSFHSYVSELRLKKATRLLTEGRRKVIDVALESGYQSLATFNHAFKKRFGATPTEWREKHGQKVIPKAGSLRRRKLHAVAVFGFLLLVSLAAFQACGADLYPI